MEISQAEQVRQIEREGAQWGLRPLVRDGKVYVAQRVYVAHAEKGHGLGCLEEKDEVICELSDEMDAWNGILANRLAREETDASIRAAERDAAIAAAQAEYRMERNRYFYDRIRSASRIMVPQWR